MTVVYNQKARVRINNVVKRFEQMSRDNGARRRPWPQDAVGAIMKFGKANGVITAGTTVGLVDIFELNDAGDTMVDTTVDQDNVNFLWMHQDEDVSDGKEVIIAKFRGEWHLIHAECEAEPAAETPMSATALKTTIADSPFAAIPGDLVLVDSTGGDFTVLLPTTPVIDNRVGVLKTVGQSDNIVIVDAGANVIVPPAAIVFPGSPTTTFVQAASELNIWRWNGGSWHVENNAHTPALVQVYRVKALPIVGLGVGVVLQWDFVPIFAGQTQVAVLLETGTFVDSRFNMQADMTADVELSFNFDHRLTGNNQNTQLNVTNNYQAASGPGVLLMGDIDAPYADPRTVTVQEDKDKVGVMFTRATDTLEFTASGTGTGAIDLIGALLTFTIG